MWPLGVRGASEQDLAFRPGGSMRQILRQTQDPELSRLLDNALKLRERQRLLIEWLGPEAHGHFHVLGWEKQVLRLGASSGAWKQWLRLQETRLASNWNQRYPADSVKKIQCKVQPALAENRHQLAVRHDAPTIRHPLGAAALRNAAQSVPDARLAAAMYRLASTLERG